ncbi:MAG: 4-hydroxythreonine-4-phosphate dehydrogenase PdxA [Pseudomonadota bacterium]
MSDNRIAPIAVSCGDPAGIGIEVTAKAWAVLKEDIPFFLIGDPGHLPDDAPVVAIEHPSKARHVIGDGVPVLLHGFPVPSVPGQPSPENARSVVEVIERGVRLVLKGDASALCTAPIAKKVLVDFAEFDYPGHTEFLAALTGVERSVMMIASDALKVVPATIHIPLEQVPTSLTRELVESTIRITHAALMRDFGVPKPRIAISGLNPHAGEDGMLGTQDGAVIRPVCEELRAEGFDIQGPLPADTMFHADARASYDAAVMMYHDQALVPAKTLAFDTGVNVTLGLPIIRTSPDHGTAFGIAGQDKASPNSMIAAIRMAHQMALARHT